MGLLPAGAVAAPASDGGVNLPALKQPSAVAVKNMRFGRDDVRPGKTTTAWSAPKVTWPMPGTETVDVRGATAPKRSQRLPVALSASARTRNASERPTKVQVSVADQAAARKAGVEGILLSVGRADGASAPGSTRVDISYDAFRGAYGGGWASRLRLVQMPACALTTPDKAACRTGTPLPTTNDTETRTLSADVALAPTADTRTSRTSATVLAVTAGDSGPTGTYKATSLEPSGSWSAGSSTGAFNWSYPISVPAVPGALQPSIALNYNSQAVDGLTGASNTQPSWIGDGWDWAPGYIERRYKSCEDDKTDGTNTVKVGDQCWFNNNAVLSLGGKTTELVFDGTDWRAANDAAEKVEKLTGADNQDGGTFGVDGTGEHWKITTADGTQYFFGRNKLPGWQDNGTAADDPVTNSAWQAPVFGNHSGEPCYNASFAAAWCQQTWRWNLDYVVDPRGNAMAYYWNKDTNYYGRNVNPTTGASTKTPYHRGGSLQRIEYGLNDPTPYRSKAMAKVNFGLDERCVLTTCGTFDATNAKNWPDVPFDLFCKDTATACTGNYSPSFWSRTRLKSITAQVLTGGAYKDVDHWALQQSYPSGSGDGISTPMWLSSITRTGRSGATPITLPAITFAPVQKPNRVDAVGDGLAPFVRMRIASITTESGGAIGVNYLDTGCTAANLPPADGTNTTRCYPVKWAFEGDTKKIDWFNSYVVDTVTEDDNVLATPNTLTKYSYLGGAKWAKSKDEFSKPEDLTYSVARGYYRVQVRKGDVTTPKTLTENRYFRGIDGEQVANSAATPVSVTDREQFAGMLRETAVYNGDGGALVSATSYTPWRSVATATRNRPAAIGDLVAYHTNVASEETRTTVPGGVRTAGLVREFDAQGMLASESQLGDLAETGDETCTLTTYARNTSAHILTTVSRVEKVAADCQSTTISRPGDGIEDIRTSYDGGAFGAAPTKGSITRKERINGTGSAYDVVTSVPSVCGTGKNLLCLDRYGRTLATADADGEISYVEHFPLTGEVPTKVTLTNPLQHKIVTEFEPLRGRTTKITDANNNVTTMTYDALGRSDKVWMATRPQATYPNGANIDFDYLIRTNDSTVVTKKVLDHNSEYQSTYEHFDGFLRARQTQTKSPDRVGSLVTETFYNSRGEAWLDSGTYFAAQQPSTTPVTGQETKYPASTETTFDGAGRPTVVTSKRFTDPEEITTTSYTGDSTTVVPPTGGTTHTVVVDALGRTTESREYAGPDLTSPQSTRFQYDKRGRLEQITDASGAKWSYTYDVRGRQTESDDPDKGTIKTTYDKADRPVDMTTVRPSATSTTLHNTYDKLGRLTALTKGTAKLAEWTYDTVAKGLPTASIRYDNGNAYRSEVTSYDELSRAVATMVTIPDAEGTALKGSYEWFNYYDQNTGQLVATEHPAIGDLPGEMVSYSYNTGGQLNTLHAGTDPLIAAATYDHYGRNTRLEYGSFAQQVFVTNEYDDHTSNLTRTYTDRELAPQRVQDSRYTYDLAGNITQIATAYGQDTARTTDTQCFSLDPLRRITQAWTNTGETCAAAPSAGVIGGEDPYWTSYTYDAVGNRKTETQHQTPAGPVTDTVRTYADPTPGTHDLTSVTQTGTDPRTETYTYDDNGNTKTRKIGNSALEALEWDDEGHLKSVTKVTDVNSFVYDTDGQRLIRRDSNGTTLYLPAGNELQLKKGATSATTTRYYGGTALRTAKGLAFTLADHHGTSTTQITADAKQTVTRRKTTVFGGPRGTQPSTWTGDKGFVGGTKDPDTNLTHIGAREYDPYLGRFISVDPLLEIDKLQTLTGYSYAANNPVTFSDPTGLGTDDGTGHTERTDGQAGQGDGVQRHDTGGMTLTVNDIAANDDPVNNVEEFITNTAKKNLGTGDAYKKWRKAYQKEIHKAPWRDYLIPEDLVAAAANSCWGSNEGICTHDMQEDLKYLDILKIYIIVGMYGDDSGIRAAGRGGKSGGKAGGKAGKSAAPSNCNQCFLAGTDVLMADGTTKDIEKIKVGDEVIATDPDTGKHGVRKVTALIVTEDDKHFNELTIATPGGAAKLTATEEHPFWVVSENRWLDARSLKQGMTLRTASGAEVAVKSNRPYASHARTFNLTVDDLHTYYVLAGATPVLVHNSNCKIDTIANDWAQKGFHVKLPGQGSAGEVSVSADADGNLLFRSTFSGKAGKAAIAKVEKDFQDPAFRGKALEQATRGLGYLEQNHSYSQQIPGLRNLVKALGR
ncbi:polymorphic toxin-type HINT domain-containing protein [Streptomyces sp. NPDC006482]|uniref:polymorphic toxin-type HINT domain-containing protein n=1 Tax=Streptomyces sp. NPDC006482 TaxID=3154306 RepID=UPI0033A37890